MPDEFCVVEEARPTNGPQSSLCVAWAWEERSAADLERQPWGTQTLAAEVLSLLNGEEPALLVVSTAHWLLEERIKERSRQSGLRGYKVRGGEHWTWVAVTLCWHKWPTRGPEGIRA